jgi:hypothetical protein
MRETGIHGSSTVVASNPNPIADVAVNSCATPSAIKISTS